jgi:hypothetical protein
MSSATEIKIFYEVFGAGETTILLLPTLSTASSGSPVVAK